MSYSNFNTFKLFQNVGINSSSDYALSMRPNDNNVSFHSSNSIDYNNVDIMSIKNIINKAPNEDLNLSSLNGTTINPVITINNNHSDCRIMTNLNVTGNINVLNGGINISKLAINGDYGSNTKYLKSGGSGSDLTWDTIASSPWTTSNNDISYTTGKVSIGDLVTNSVGQNNTTEKLHLQGNLKIGGSYTYERIIAGNLDFHTNTCDFFVAPGQTQSFYNGSDPVNDLKFFISPHSTGVSAHAYNNISDDRLKINEELIQNSTNILLKLRPQIYDKKDSLSGSVTKKEAGLIVQEIYYEAPELRYLINIPDDATLIDDNKYRNFDDIRNDPDYSNWGTSPAYLNYIGLIPYLIKGFQEQQNEINTLKTENAELKSIIDKLKTANSFEEFKNSL
jgi:hypothetical protein